MYYLISLFSAVLFAVAVPGQVLEDGSFLLGLFSLAPYFYVLLSCRERRAIVGCGCIFGFITSFCSYYWLIFYQNFAAWTITSVSLAHGVVQSIMALVMVRVTLCHPLWRATAIALIWSAYEFLTSIGYLGLPWGTSGLAATQSLLFIQHIELTGMWTVHFIMTFANAIIAEALFHYQRSAFRFLWQQATIWLLLVAAALSFGLYRLRTPLPVEDEVKFLLVQQNTDAWNEGYVAALQANIALSRRGLSTESAARPEMVIWSETSIGLPYIEYIERYQSTPADDPLVNFITSEGVPLLSGSPYIDLEVEGVRKVYNAVLLIGPAGEVEDYYGKRHMVPFAEHVPFWDIPAVQKFYNNVIGLSGTWNRGNVDALMTLERAGGERIDFGVLVCFEDSFSYLARDIAARGGQLLINLTNNSWSRRRAAQVQHLSTARLRAIETRRALVRSTNSGESVLVDGYGVIRTRLPSFEKGYLAVTAPIYSGGLTLYTRWGNYVAQFQLWSALLLWVGALYPRTRRLLQGDNRPY